MYRPEGTMASADLLRITVKGKRGLSMAHCPGKALTPSLWVLRLFLGYRPSPADRWTLHRAPSIVTIGIFSGKVRNNIIPDEVQLEGTIRTFSERVQDDLHRRVKRTAESIAASQGATATVEITRQYPVTFNHPALTESMLPTLQRVAGTHKVSMAPPVTAAEDFSFFAQRAPGMYFFLGSNKAGVDLTTAPANHSPLYEVDEGVLPLGVRALANLAVDYLSR